MLPESNPDGNLRVQILMNDKLSIDLFGIVDCPPGWNGPNHSHNFWELIYIYKEKADHYQFLYKGKIFEFQESEMFLIAPGVSHSFCNIGMVEAYNMYIGFSFHLDGAECGKWDFPIDFLQDMPERKLIQGILNEIINFSQEDMKMILRHKRIQALECIAHVVEYMAKRASNAVLFNANKSIVVTEKVKKYLCNNIEKHINIEEVANEFYLSPNYLGQIFKSTTGMTLKQYHNMKRMEFALKILGQGEYSVTDTAYKLGFDDVAYFSKKFKEQFGFSPSMFVGSKEKNMDEY